MSEIKEPNGCQDVQRQLLEAPDLLDPEVERHLERCPACRTLRAQILLLDEAVREQAPALPEGFELSLRRRLGEVVHESTEQQEQRDVGAAPRAHRQWRRAVLAAAVVLVAIGGVLLARHWQTDEPPTYHRLHLAIKAAHAVDEVLIDVDLPRGVKALPTTNALVGRGDRLRWRTRIEPGLNELDLPLVARRCEGNVRVRLTAGGQALSSSVALKGASARRQNGALRGLELALALGGGRP